MLNLVLIMVRLKHLYAHMQYVTENNPRITNASLVVADFISLHPTSRQEGEKNHMDVLALDAASQAVETTLNLESITSRANTWIYNQGIIERRPFYCTICFAKFARVKSHSFTTPTRPSIFLLSTQVSLFRNGRGHKTNSKRSTKTRGRNSSKHAQ